MTQQLNLSTLRLKATGGKSKQRTWQKTIKKPGAMSLDTPCIVQKGYVIYSTVRGYFHSKGRYSKTKTRQWSHEPSWAKFYDTVEQTKPVVGYLRNHQDAALDMGDIHVRYAECIVYAEGESLY